MEKGMNPPTFLLLCILTKTRSLAHIMFDRKQNDCKLKKYPCPYALSGAFM